MKLLLILAALALPFIPQHSNADEAYIGLQTYHFSRDGRDCLNERNNLVAYSNGRYHVGTYENSQCRRSYLVGIGYELEYGLGVDISAVTGYPSSMHLVKGLTLIPMLTHATYFGNIGVKVIYVPTVLIGIGGALRF